MKKLLTALLATVCAVSVTSAGVIALANSENETETGTTVSKWTKSVTDSNSAVTLTNISGGGVKMAVEKSGNAFGGAKLDLSEQIGAVVAEDHEGGILGLVVKVDNLKALSNSSLTLKVALKDAGEWKVSANQLTDKEFPAKEFPALSEIGESELTIDLTSMPDGASPEKITALTVGVEGSENAEIAIKDVNILYSDTASLPAEKVYVKAEPMSGQLLGKYQYGANVTGTATKTETVTDADKSRDKDGSALRVSVDGSGPLENNYYAVYFDLRQQQSLPVSAPAGLSFWVYNHKSIGGRLVFKDNSSTQITSGIKVSNADGTELTENDCNLNYTGFRRYEVPLTESQLAGSEFQIALYNAEEGAAYDLSAFSFVDYQVPESGDISLPSVGDLSFTNFSTTGSMTVSLDTEAEHSKQADGKSGCIVRNECNDFDMSSIYMQNFPEVIDNLGAQNPVSISFWVYSAKVLSFGGLMFKFGGTEVYPYRYENEDGTVGDGNRDLNYIGFRKYSIKVNPDDLTQREFQLGIWGTSAAEVYFSDFSVYNEIKKATDDLKPVSVDFAASELTAIEAEYEVELTESNGINYVVNSVNSNGSSYIERSLDDILGENSEAIKLTMASENINENHFAIELTYDDGSGVAAVYRAVNAVEFTSSAAKDVTVSFTSLPYFITAKTVTALRIAAYGSGNLSLNISGIQAVAGTGSETKEVYSHVISDFEKASDLYVWGIASHPDAVATKEHTTQAKVGNGAMSYNLISGSAENFTWSEVSVSVGDLISKNTESDIKGISFWLYNDSYITVGTFGFWIKVAMSNAAEYEVKSSYVQTENRSGNSLGFEGWEKVEVPLISEAYGECVDYSHTGAPFDWKQLAYIKIGFWGFATGCDTIIDDVRIVSGKPLTVGAVTHSITYNLNGGELPEGTATTFEQGAEFTLPTPTRNGYVFEGWYTNNGLVGDKITSIPATETSDVTVYASWKEETGCNSTGCNSVGYGPSVNNISTAGFAAVAVLAFVVVRKFISKKKRKNNDV